MKRLIHVLLLLFLCSCNLDRVTYKYETFEQASKDGLFEKGWIPNELINDDIKDIYLQNDIDINTFIFSFQSHEKPIILDMGHKLQNEKVKLHRINIPKSWNSEILGHPKTTLQTDNGLVNIVVNSDLNKVYGWGKYSR